MIIPYLYLFHFHVSNSAIFFTKYSGILHLHRRSLDTFYMKSIWVLSRKHFTCALTIACRISGRPMCLYKTTFSCIVRLPLFVRGLLSNIQHGHHKKRRLLNWEDKYDYIWIAHLKYIAYDTVCTREYVYDIHKTDMESNYCQLAVALSVDLNGIMLAYP